MTQTLTRQYTYTVTDISKTFEFFHSNLRLFSECSGVENHLVDDRAADVVAFARAKYIEAVHVMLFDGQDSRLRAAKFTISEDAGTWKSDLPGGTLWPRTPGGHISIVVSYNQSWYDLSEGARQKFKSALRLNWRPSDRDTTYADMVADETWRYASNNYGLAHTGFRSK